ncbi:MAG: class I SAM-dependent methyltransferase [bacterium]|nr:class I SAM-dependent methyltransferase [bacterium]
MQDVAYQSMSRLQTTHWWWRGMRRVYRRILRTYGSHGGVTADIGCGFGANLPVLQDETAPRLLVGVDVSFDALDSIPRRPGLALVQARADALPFRAGAFDTLALLAVVEHVEHDEQVVGEAYRVCKPGGLQVLLTSAFMILWSHHDTANGHIRRYRTAALERLQRAAGWHVLHNTYVNVAIFPLVALVRQMQRRSRPSGDSAYDMGPNPPVIRRILESLLALEAMGLLRGVRFPFGVDVVNVCRKPSGEDA